MSKTNSNSITSILAAALNSNNSQFRIDMLKYFGNKIGRSIDDTIRFYDSSHSPLLYSEMKGTEIDIIARVPGVHKPIMMIEIKASAGETLQPSQSNSKKEGTYKKTSEKYNIPLIYIIPEKYIHDKNIPENAIKIYWEKIRNITKKLKEIKLDKLIDSFVEITEKSNQFPLDKKINTSLENIKKLLEKNINIENISDLQNDQWGIGYYFSTKKPKADYFIGFTPDYKEDKKFFSLCIAESCKNIDLGDRNKNPKERPMFFNDGWYYFPLGKNMLDKNIKMPDVDKKHIDKNILKAISNNKKIIDELIKDVRTIFA